MNSRILPIFFLGMMFIVLPALELLAAPLAPDQALKLPSGHVARILSISKVEYAKGEMALMVRYQTALSMDEAKAVSQEVDEVWDFAQKEAERAQYSKAIISSNHTVKGLILTTNREVNFIYERGTDGKWVRLGRGDLVARE